jgi:hypothetical protein
MSRLRSSTSRRAAPTRTSEKSDVPPPMSATSTVSSPATERSWSNAAAIGSY